MKKILHIGNDDKFIPLGKHIFDATPNCENTFWINPKTSDLQFVKFPCSNIFNKNLNTDEYIQKINQYDLVCIHFLNDSLFPLLNSKQITVPILWIGWGGDYYWLIETSKKFQLFLPETHKIASKFNIPIQLNSVVNKLKKNLRHKRLKTVNNNTYFSPAFQEEFDIIQQNYSNFKPQFIDWNYGYIHQELIDKYKPYFCIDNKVLIGNSSTPTNNHLDIFKILDSELQEHELILPLSYGNDIYKEKVVGKAKNNFKNVQILDDFMSEDEYNKILIQCRNVIVGSMRQQAVGTIITSMYMGANIFIFEDSINYKHFKNNGFHLYSIQELKQNPALLNSQLTQEQIQENREKINYLWSIEKNRDTIVQLLESL